MLYLIVRVNVLFLIKGVCLTSEAVICDSEFSLTSKKFSPKKFLFLSIFHPYEFPRLLLTMCFWFLSFLCFMHPLGLHAFFLLSFFICTFAYAHLSGLKINIYPLPPLGCPPITPSLCSLHSLLCGVESFLFLCLIIPDSFLHLPRSSSGSTIPLKLLCIITSKYSVVKSPSLFLPWFLPHPAGFNITDHIFFP